ncbi:hypothetical protein [Maricurvus nonylphenolicus]|uniref:hypothetical protein n=1 Tax=Maricurvus nonylphenolicus TaxID=1008307 RepID=UPI0036F2C5D2
MAALLCVLLHTGSTQAVTEASTSEAPQPISQDAKIIYWVKPAFEPLYIAAGPLRDRGAGDLVIADLERHLPQYDHRVMRANYIRLMGELRRGHNVCAILHYTPERETYTHYSDMLLLIPSYQIYSSVGSIDKLKHHQGWLEGNLGFEPLLANSPKLRMALTPGHSYGKERDNIIGRYREQLNIVRGYAGHETLLKMLMAMRLDVILELPWVINHYQKQFGIDPAQLHKVTLNDVPAFEPVYIVCPKNPWGKAVVTAVNGIEPSISGMVRHYIEDWLKPEEIIEYRKANSIIFPESFPDTIQE